MTFEEAKNKKESLELVDFIESEIKFKVFITPQNNKDFRKYLTKIRGYFKNLIDEDAKQFSTDGKYDIYGLFYNGKDVVYKKI